MSSEVPEKDWKELRKLREVALERLCERALHEAATILGDGSKSCHERFLALHTMIESSNREMAAGFDDPRRSRLIEQLAVLVDLELLDEQELARFSAPTREAAETLATLQGRRT